MNCAASDYHETGRLLGDLAWSLIKESPSVGEAMIFLSCKERDGREAAGCICANVMSASTSDFASTSTNVVGGSNAAIAFPMIQ